MLDWLWQIIRPSILNKCRDSGEMATIIWRECWPLNEFKPLKARQIFRGLRIRVLASRLSNSRIGDNVNLFGKLRSTSLELRGATRRRLERFRAAVVPVVATQVTSASDARELLDVLVGICSEDNPNLSSVPPHWTHQLLTGVNVASLVRILERSSLRNLLELDRFLEALVANLGNERPVEFDRLREATQASARPALERARSLFLAARNAAAMKEVIVSTCIEFDDGRGHQYEAGVKAIFHGFVAANATQALAKSNLKSLKGLIHALRHLRSGRRIDCDELKQLHLAALQAASPRMKEVRWAAEMEAIIDTCSVDNDYSGVRALFTCFSPAENPEQLRRESDLSDLRSLARRLRRAQENLGAPACPGLEQLRLEVARAVGRGLTTVADPQGVVNGLNDACCMDDDPRGPIFPDLARTVFEELQLAGLVEKIRSAVPEERKRLASVLARIAKAIHHPVFRELEDLAEFAPTRSGATRRVQKLLVLVRSPLTAGDRDALIDQIVRQQLSKGNTVANSFAASLQVGGDSVDDSTFCTAAWIMQFGKGDEVAQRVLEFSFQGLAGSDGKYYILYDR